MRYTTSTYMIIAARRKNFYRIRETDTVKTEEFYLKTLKELSHILNFLVNEDYIIIEILNLGKQIVLYNYKNHDNKKLIHEVLRNNILEIAFEVRYTSKKINSDNAINYYTSVNYLKVIYCHDLEHLRRALNYIKMFQLTLYEVFACSEKKFFVLEFDYFKGIANNKLIDFKPFIKKEKAKEGGN